MPSSKIDQKMEQQQFLTPQQLIKVNILQLNAAMLETRIYEELEKNPALEIIETDDEPTKSDEKNDSPDDMDWDEELKDQWTSSGHNDYDIENTLKHQSGITDQVVAMLRDENLNEEDILIAEQIAGNLDDQGYLTIEPELISDRLGIDANRVLDIMKKIQHSNAPGLASQNVQQCLIAQLQVYEISDLSSQIIDKCFDDFINKRYDMIKSKLKCDNTKLKEALNIISQLNPNPRSMIDEAELGKETIIPDIIIEQMNNNWNIVVNDSNQPDLYLSENYLKMSKDPDQKRDVKNFLKKKIKSAKWFLEAISSRNNTIQRIMSAIISKQDKYFNSDTKDLVPMILKEVAEDLKIDISTVSRATKGKYVQMPWGIKELSFFFSQGISTIDGEVSSKKVEEMIKQIIDSENKVKPLNDDEIMENLIDQGINIARRTVAKYRVKLNFPTARLRKELE